MTISKARLTLALIFLLGLVIQAIAIILTFNENAISSDDLINLLLKLLAIYSIHFAIIIGGIFAQNKVSEKRSKPIHISKIALYLAITFAVIWNFMLMWRSIAFSIAAYDITQDDSVREITIYFDSVAAASSFLVAGALTFFFTKQE